MEESSVKDDDSIVQDEMRTKKTKQKKKQNKKTYITNKIFMIFFGIITLSELKAYATA